MDELITWLRAQLDADEKATRKAAGGGTLGPDNYGHLTVPAHWMLADIESKRRIIAMAVDAFSQDWSPMNTYQRGWAGALHQVLLRIALPYADREGFREEWRA